MNRKILFVLSFFILTISHVNAVENAKCLKVYNEFYLENRSIFKTNDKYIDIFTPAGFNLGLSFFENRTISAFFQLGYDWDGNDIYADIGYIKLFNNDNFSLKYGTVGNIFGKERNYYFDRCEFYVFPTFLNIMHNIEGRGKYEYPDKTYRTSVLQALGTYKWFYYNVNYDVKKNDDYDNKYLTIKNGVNLIDEVGIDCGITYLLDVTGDNNYERFNYDYNSRLSNQYAIYCTFKKDIYLFSLEYFENSHKFKPYSQSYFTEYSEVSNSYVAEVRLNPFKNKANEILFQYDTWVPVVGHEEAMTKVSAGIKYNLYKNFNFGILYHNFVKNDSVYKDVISKEALRTILTYKF